MPKALNYDRELVKALFVQGFTPTQIARKTGLNANSVATWSKRGDWTAIRSKTCESLSQPLERLAALTIAERSARVRSALADEVGESVGALRQTPAKPELQHLNQRAEVAGKLTGAAAKVFGWSDSSSGNAILVLGMMKQALDVEVNAPDLLSCGPDTTTGSVSDTVSDSTTPQDAQLVDCQQVTRHVG